MEGSSYRRARKQFGTCVYTFNQLRLLLRNRNALLRLLGKQQRSMAFREHGIRARRNDVHTSHIQPYYLQKDGQRVGRGDNLVSYLYNDDDFRLGIVHSDLLRVNNFAEAFR